jgi:hypothetical protein
VVVLAGLAAAAAVVYGYLQRRPVQRAREAARELDRADPRWRLADIEADREQVPDDYNSARVAGMAAKLLPSDWNPAALDRHLRVAPNVRLSAEVAGELEDERKAVRAALEAACLLAGLPRGRFPVSHGWDRLRELLGQQQQLHFVEALLRHEAVRQAQAGRAREAVRACLAGLNAARAIGDEPNAVSQSIRITCTVAACWSTQRLLAQLQPDPADLEALQDAFRSEDAYNVLLVGLRGERALREALLEAVEAGEVAPTELFVANPREPPWTMRFLTELGRGDVLTLHPHYLSVMTPRVEAALRPLHEQAAADRAFQAACRAVPADGSVALGLMAWVQPYSEECRRHHAILRCLSTALAAECYRRSHGRWPASLEPLVSRLPGGVTVDPYNGEPLHLKRVSDGVLIYSVGPDGVDNGGQIDRRGWGRGDVGIRLWDVARRGAS